MTRLPSFLVERPHPSIWVGQTFTDDYGMTYVVTKIEPSEKENCDRVTYKLAPGKEAS